MWLTPYRLLRFWIIPTRSRPSCHRTERCQSKSDLCVWSSDGWQRQVLRPWITATCLPERTSSISWPYYTKYIWSWVSLLFCFWIILFHSGPPKRDLVKLLFRWCGTWRLRDHTTSRSRHQLISLLLRPEWYSMCLSILHSAKKVPGHL